MSFLSQPISNLTGKQWLTMTAVMTEMSAVLLITGAVANVFSKLKYSGNKYTNNISDAITWEHHILLPAVILLGISAIITMIVVTSN